MNRALQLRLAGMTLEEFKEWHGVPVNADSLPVFHNFRWLEHQTDPVEEIHKSVQNWAEKHPYPTPEQLAELQSKNLWKRTV
jgi:hypothetical protein